MLAQVEMTFYLCIAFEGRQLKMKQKRAISKRVEKKLKLFNQKFLETKKPRIFAAQ